MKQGKEGRDGRDGDAATAHNKNMKNHCNRFKRIELSLDMRLVIVALTMTFLMFPAYALSLTEFEAKPAHDRATFVVDFVEKSTAGLYEKNPQMAQTIRDWFSKVQDGKPFSEGIEKLGVELTALDLLGREGKADLSKIQVEGVIVKVIKDRFPPVKQ
jgi:hypothetical protein